MDKYSSSSSRGCGFVENRAIPKNAAGISGEFPGIRIVRKMGFLWKKLAAPKSTITQKERPVDKHNNHPGFEALGCAYVVGNSILSDRYVLCG